MAEKKKAATKATAKKKAVEVPANPDRTMGAVVRTIHCEKAQAAKLVGSFGFFVTGEDDGTFTCVADLTANLAYEAAR